MCEYNYKMGIGDRGFAPMPNPHLIFLIIY